MRCLVTAGPTYEKLDEVRRLTNFSTGRLGSELSRHLTAAGHETVLLIGQQATWRGERRAQEVHTFTTTENLQDWFHRLARHGRFDAVFHAAAVSDFRFGKAWQRQGPEHLVEYTSGKYSTRTPLLVELVPTPKLLRELPALFPGARIAGWKYEVEGGRDAVLEKGHEQLRQCGTAACVVNGPAYGSGFGLLTPAGPPEHCSGSEQLFAALARWIEKR